MPVTVVRGDIFDAATGNRNADAVTIIVDGRPQVLLREGAADPALALREEGLHVLQLSEPEWARRAGALSEDVAGRWHELSLPERVEAHRRQVELEIDAQARLADGLVALAARTGDPRVLGQLAAVDLRLRGLKERKATLDALGPARQLLVRLGARSEPPFLREPARLFNERDGDAPLRALYDDAYEPIRQEVQAALDENFANDKAKTAEVNGRVEAGTQNAPAHDAHTYDHIVVGTGFAAVASTMGRTNRTDNELMIGGPNPWATGSSAQLLGQGADAGVDLPGAPQGRRFADTIQQTDARYARAVEHGYHVEVNRNKENLAAYNGRVVEVQHKDKRRADWPADRSDATVRLLVRGEDGYRFIYAKNVDLASGPGPSRDLGPYRPRDTGDFPIQDAARALVNESIVSEQTMQQMFGDNRFHIGDQAFSPASVTRGESVAIYGGGASAAWAAQASRLGAGPDAEVNWYGRVNRGAFPEGDRALYEDAFRQLRAGTLPEDSDGARRLADIAFAGAAIPRNQLPGGAMHPDMNIPRRAGELMRVEYDPDTKKVKLYFDDDPHNPVIRDHLVIAIGQDASRPGGPAAMVKRDFVNDLVPAGRFDEPILQSTDGSLRLIGMAAVQPAVMKMMRDNKVSLDMYNELTRTARRFHPDSPGVVGGFYHLREALETSMLTDGRIPMRDRAPTPAQEAAFQDRRQLGADLLAMVRSGPEGELLARRLLASTDPPRDANVPDTVPRPSNVDQAIADTRHLLALARDAETPEARLILQAQVVGAWGMADPSARLASLRAGTDRDGHGGLSDPDAPVHVRVGNEDHHITVRDGPDGPEVWICSLVCAPLRVKMDAMAQTPEGQRFKDELAKLYLEADRIENAVPPALRRQALWELASKLRQIGEQDPTLNAILDAQPDFTDFLGRGDKVITVRGDQLGELINPDSDNALPADRELLYAVYEVLPGGKRRLLKVGEERTHLNSDRDDAQPYFVDRFDRYRRTANRLNIKIEIEVAPLKKQAERGDLTREGAEQKLREQADWGEKGALPWDATIVEGFDGQSRLGPEHVGPGLPFEPLPGGSKLKKTHVLDPITGRYVPKSPEVADRIAAAEEQELAAFNAERKRLINLLIEHGGNVPRIAEKEGLTKQGMSYRLKVKYKLDPKSYRKGP